MCPLALLLEKRPVHAETVETQPGGKRARDAPMNLHSKPYKPRQSVRTKQRLSAPVSGGSGLALCPPRYNNPLMPSNHLIEDTRFAGLRIMAQYSTHETRNTSSDSVRFTTDGRYPPQASNFQTRVTRPMCRPSRTPWMLWRTLTNTYVYSINGFTLQEDRRG